MIAYEGVAMTDGINRKNHIFPLETIIDSYHDKWNVAIPMNLGHDRSKLIGFTELTGIYMEPGKAYLTNIAKMPETEEEFTLLTGLTREYDYKIFASECEEELSRLSELLGEKKSSDSKIVPTGQSVAIWDEGIVGRVFPELAENVKDGLIDLRLLEPIYQKAENNANESLLIPGVYRKDNFLLFAHHYFRRSLSMANATNGEFFNVFEKLRSDESLKLQVALDFDMIGLAGTECLEMEYQYLWGPNFNEDLTSIPEGVTCYKNEHYDNLFSNITQTQFYWHFQDGKKEFECEELCDRENITLDNGKTFYWGCRYVHSMIDDEALLPYHLDGAIRIYSDEQIIERLDETTDIKKYGKEAGYFKLWRIDNVLSVSTWKELISCYYRDNQLIGEYFGGTDEKYDRIKKECSERNAIVQKPNEFIPVDFNPKDGIRIFFRYMRAVRIPEDKDVKVINKDVFIFRDGKKEKILEADTLTFLKLLKRKGLQVRIPYTTMVEFGDMVFNYPTFACKNVAVLDTVIEAMLDLCKAWDRKGDNRLISFGIVLNLDEKEAVQISFAGHVTDFVQLFEKLPKVRETKIEDWMIKVYNANNIYKEANGRPDKFLLLHGDVVCFDRKIIAPEQIERVWMEGEKVLARHKLTKEEAQYAYEHKIISAPFYKIKECECMKCGGNYRGCQCIKFIDSGVTDRPVDAEFWGMTWTNRSAYYPEGQMELI